jgi:uncharacterized membrane protein YfcA
LELPDLATILFFALTGLILAVALVYSAAGLGGASGFLAIMALFGNSPIAYKPMVLILTIIVALIGTVRYYRAGFFSWRTFWPFAVGSAPTAFFVSNARSNETLQLPMLFLKILIALIIFYSAARLFFRIRDKKKTTVVPIWIAVSIGVAFGSITGLTGVGGGIFLSPLLLVMHWATPEETCGVSAAFILVNTVAAMLTNASVLLLLPGEAVWWLPAAIVGGWVGTEIGTRGLPIFGLRPLLASVFVLGGLRFLMGG